MKEIVEQFEKYAKNFDKLVALKREQDKLIKEVLDPLGQKLRADLEELQTKAAVKAGNRNTMILAGEALKQLHAGAAERQQVARAHDEGFAKGAETALCGSQDALTASRRRSSTTTCASYSTTSTPRDKYTRRLTQGRPLTRTRSRARQRRDGKVARRSPPRPRRREAPPPKKRRSSRRR